MVRSKQHIAILFFGLCLSLVCVSCEKEVEQPRHMVVEGWIESGKEPVVMLHYAYNVKEEDEDKNATIENSFQRQLITLAKVTVSDGEQEVILTSEVNMKYMLPYIYTTTHMVGEPGKTYTITASRDGITETATTTIPPVSPQLESISVRTLPDSTAKVTAQVSLPASLQSQKLIFALRREGQPQSFVCRMGAKEITTPTLNVPIYTPNRVLSAEGSAATLGGLESFSSADTCTYYLRVAAVDDISYRIWEGICAQSINQGMFYMGIYHNIPSNISSSRGYWCGYNAVEQAFTLQRDTVFRCR